MDSKIFKLIDLILLPVFIVMLDFVSTYTIFSSTRIIVGIFTIIYLLYAGVVYVLEEMNILQRNIVNFYDQMLYDLSDKVIILCILLPLVAMKKVWLFAYFILIATILLKLGKKVLLANNGIEVKDAYTRINIGFGYLGTILVLLTPSVLGITTFYIIPYILINLLETIQIFREN